MLTENDPVGEMFVVGNWHYLPSAK